MDTMKLLPVIAALTLPTAANAVVLVETSDPGFYNNSLETILNNTNGGNTSMGYFPTSNDANVDFPVAPDLAVADAILGDWLTDPFNLNSNWDYLESIPNMWDIGTEVAVIYQFDTLEATNVVASFGVDNGIYVWLDGEYLGGARRAGTVIPGEHVFDIGDLDAGSHYLQIILEDHGTTNGYDVLITADTFTPAVPVPATFWLFGSGLVGLVGLARQRL